MEDPEESDLSEEQSFGQSVREKLAEELSRTKKELELLRKENARMSLRISFIQSPLMMRKILTTLHR